MNSEVKEEQPRENQEKEQEAGVDSLSIFAEQSECILVDYAPSRFLSSQSEWWLKFVLGTTSTLLVAGGMAWWRRKQV